MRQSAAQLIVSHRRRGDIRYTGTAVMLALTMLAWATTSAADFGGYVKLELHRGENRVGVGVPEHPALGKL